MSTPNETTKNEEMLQESTTNDRIIFTPEVIAFLEKAANAEQAYYAEQATTTDADKQQERVDLADLVNHADDIMAGTVTYLDDDLLSPAAQSCSKRLVTSCTVTRDHKTALPTFLYIDALIASPEAVQASLRAVRDGLVAADPMWH